MGQGISQRSTLRWRGARQHAPVVQQATAVVRSTERANAQPERANLLPQIGRRDSAGEQPLPELLEALRRAFTLSRPNRRHDPITIGTFLAWPYPHFYAHQAAAPREGFA